MDQGREMYERLKDDGWTLLEEWHREQEPETLHLEFKLKDDPIAAAIGDADRTNVAKTLSAFANTEGGLLVLGVDAGAGQRGGFDRMNRIAPIADVESFGGALERRIRTFTDPPVRGLMLTPIRAPGEGMAGVLAVYVPQSKAGPHRVTNAGAEANDRYYMRTASGAQTIPHSLLAALFAYAAPPRLEFRARFTSFDGNNGGMPWVEMRLRNLGRAAARRPVVVLYDPPLLRWIQPRSGMSYHRERTEDGRSALVIEPTTDNVIYPGLDLVVAFEQCERGASSHLGGLFLTFEGQIVSLDTVPVAGKATLSIAPDEDQDVARNARAVFGHGEQQGLEGAEAIREGRR